MFCGLAIGKGTFYPFDCKDCKEVEKKHSKASPSLNNSFFYLWRNVLSEVDGPKCPHYPTCGHFFHKSLKKYYYKAFYYTASRLLEEFDSLEKKGYYPLRKYYDVWRFYDPIENYATLETIKYKQPEIINN